VLTSYHGPGELLVINPLDEHFATEKVKLARPLGTITANNKSMSTFLDPEGTQTLVVNNYGTSSIIKLFSRPGP